MLIRARLFHLPELDAQLVRMISAGRSNLATDLAVHLVRTCLVGDPVVTAADLFNTLDTLAKIACHSSNGPAVLMLVEQARQVTRSASSPPHPCCLHLQSGGCTCSLTSWSAQRATCMSLRSTQWQCLCGNGTTVCCNLWTVTPATVVSLHCMYAIVMCPATI